MCVTDGCRVASARLRAQSAPGRSPGGSGSAEAIAAFTLAKAAGSTVDVGALGRIVAASRHLRHEYHRGLVPGHLGPDRPERRKGDHGAARPVLAGNCQ
jgi:hypothetical protein